ncbi:MAG: hypothetical protein JST40_14520 [Armatimonadetes bacterium]|nr:hypothetical protein [Armatimonadota bacterium]
MSSTCKMKGMVGVLALALGQLLSQDLYVGFVSSCSKTFVLRDEGRAFSCGSNGVWLPLWLGDQIEVSAGGGVALLLGHRPPYIPRSTTKRVELTESQLAKAAIADRAEREGTTLWIPKGNSKGVSLPYSASSPYTPLPGRPAPLCWISKPGTDHVKLTLLDEEKNVVWGPKVVSSLNASILVNDAKERLCFIEDSSLTERMIGLQRVIADHAAELIVESGASKSSRIIRISAISRMNSAKSPSEIGSPLELIEQLRKLIRSSGQLVGLEPVGLTIQLMKLKKLEASTMLRYVLRAIGQRASSDALGDFTEKFAQDRPLVPYFQQLKCRRLLALGDLRAPN